MKKSLLSVALSFVLVVSLLPLQPALADEGSLSVAATDELSAAAPEASEPVIVYKGVSVLARANAQGVGWGAWVKAGTTLGSARGKGVKSLQVKLTGLNGLTGSIQYQTYKRGSGWKAVAADGKSTASARNVEAIRMKLTGSVASHYDVLYRTYMSGKGWQPWAKNNAKSGVTGKKSRVVAVQVKLSAKTEEAAGKSTSRVGVRYEAHLSSTGWQAWKGDGSTAGKKKKQLTGVAIKSDAGELSGGIKYRAYNTGKNWTGWKSNGAYAGKTSKRLEAIEVKLTGELAKSYDVYYRAYVQGIGWLDWAKNGATAGGTGFNLRLEAFQVKLVSNTGAAPGSTQYPTVNLMEQTKTLDGIDIASWQAGLDPAKVKADFIIVKATGGKKYTNPYFKNWADATLKSGKLLGLYHFAREASSPGSATAEAKHFVKQVGSYVGKAVLFLDFEGSALDMNNCVKWAKKFMDTVYKKTGVKPLIYTSKNYTRAFDWSSVAKKYGLWVAQYPNYNAVKGYKASPWTDSYGYGAWSAPTLFQYTSQGYIKGYGSNLDLNKFYGSILSWKKLARKS